MIKESIQVVKNGGVRETTFQTLNKNHTMRKIKLYSAFIS